MKVSVVIPTFNSATTIRDTLNSVLNQTSPADQIIVLDDGSYDDTISIVRDYEPNVSLVTQLNQGVAAARNRLCEMADADLVAFLDHDDIWHPQYLEYQRSLFSKHPGCIAFFTAHQDFNGYGPYVWPELQPRISPGEVMSAIDFCRRYNDNTELFSSMSFCAVTKRLLSNIETPFCTEVSGADDYYFFNLLPIYGSIVYSKTVLVAYRMTPKGQSANRLKGLQLSVRAMDILRPKYKLCTDSALQAAFGKAHASRRRQYAKYLLGAGQSEEARRELMLSLSDYSNCGSAIKSLSLFVESYLPAFCQPKWPSAQRSQHSIPD